MQALIGEFGAAIDEPERLNDFNALVSRTLGSTRR
jgi:hypothetical protein